MANAARTSPRRRFGTVESWAVAKCIALRVGLAAVGAEAARVDPPAAALPLNGIAEWALQFNATEVLALRSASAPTPSVWEAVNITLDLVPPPGAPTYNATIQGFHYAGNEWRVRAALRGVGPHQYTLVAVAGNITLHKSTGTVVCSATAAAQNTSVGPRGFLRPRFGAAPYRTAFEDGTLFTGLGLGDCLNDQLTWQTFNETDHSKYTRTLAEYTADYGEAGFNIFRWSNGNCAWHIEESFDASVTPWRPVGNVYNETLALLLDQLYDGFRARGFSMWAVPFAKETKEPVFPHMGESNTTWHMAQQQAIERHIGFVVSRWGAQTDVWSLLNEQRAESSWLAFAARYLRSIDPYNHPITSSWNDHLNMTEIELDSVHWYYSGPTTKSDTAMATVVESELAHGKPVYFTESGNQAHNWDPDSHTRMRIRSWVAFFKAANLLWWNTASTRSCHPCGGGNMYLGPTERGYNLVLRRFADAMTDPAVAAVEVQAGEGVNAFGLQGAATAGGAAGRTMMVYVQHAANHTTDVTTSITVPGAAGCTGAWVSPTDGTEIPVTVPPASGGAPSVSLATPPFAIDVALRLSCK